MSLLNEIKSEARKSGGSLGKIFFVKDGEKRRVRFLTDFEDVVKIPWLNCYDKNINCPNPTWYGKPNPYKNVEGIKEDTMYCWQVYDYDSNSVKPFLYKANNCSPVYGITNTFETFGTLLDRDLVIFCDGKGSDRSMTVTNQDKAKFRQPVKKLSKQRLTELVVDAYAKYQGEEESGEDYTSMKPVELYQLCKEREIEAEKKKPKAYYVNLLEEYDIEHASESGFDDEDEEWGEDEEQQIDYTTMKPKELFLLCKEREIETKPKQSANFYIDLLEAYDDEQVSDDDWIEGEGEADEWEEDVDEWADDKSELPFN